MGANALRIGNVELLSLVDSEMKAPCAALMPQVTKEQWAPFSDFLLDDCTNMQLTVPSFVLRSEGKTVVIDTGIGAKDRPYFTNGRLPEALAEAGVQPADVDLVMATHIHIDHVGWHTTAQDGGYVPTFPNARYVFNRPEFEFFTSPEEVDKPDRAYVRDCVVPLIGNATIDLVDGEHKLTDELVLMPTPGHTPAHVSIAIMSAGESAVIIGDVCHHPAQVTETGWSPVFDMNPALAAQTRESLMQKLEDDRTLMIAGHFPHPGFGRIVRTNNRRTWLAA